MKFKVLKPIIYDGVLQRGKVYDSDDMKISDKHVNVWAKKRFVKILDDEEMKRQEVEENKAIAPQENKQNDEQFTKSQLEKKKVDDLKEVAKEHDVELNHDMKKADIIKAILEG